MVKLIRKSGNTRGLPPGSVVHVGDKKTADVHISVFDYSAAKTQEYDITNVEECFSLKQKPSISWINVDGIHDVEIIQKLGDCFKIHPLVLEDIVNTNQRPKIEEYDSYLFLVVKMLSIDEQTQELRIEQVSLILGSNYVISFQEQKGDVFTSVRERIRTDKGQIRRMGADYLAYSLIDAIIDNYFGILEGIAEEVEIIEQDVISDPKPEILEQIYHLKQKMIHLRKSVWPLREVINSALRDDSALIKQGTKIFLRDVYDHTIQVIDTIETFRDMISGMLDIYMSSVSNKMNEVMKVLTIFAAIFIPLTFIAGIYGMNFVYMPELSLRWTYPLVWIVFIVVGASLLAFFKYKKWI